MGEYVGSTEFYGITVELEEAFPNVKLDENFIDDIILNDWTGLEKPELLVLCNDLGLDVEVLCNSDKIGNMYLYDLENIVIGIGMNVNEIRIDEKIKKLQLAKEIVTQDKIDKICQYLNIDKNSYMSKIRLDTYYSQS